jgi:hypothetical protein
VHRALAHELHAARLDGAIAFVAHGFEELVHRRRNLARSGILQHVTATSPADRRVPALLVSGFLGSGKTTLVRNLLADARAQGLRLAIVSNEFGELGIDRALLGGGDETFVELGGGCVCCQLGQPWTRSRLRERVDPDRS